MHIYASRIESAQDFFDTFRNRLADGLIGPDFYRPVQSLSIALDYALWGLNPFGYQLQTMLVFATVVLLLYAATRRLLGSNAWLGPSVAALFFALHPALLNVLPTPCRRADLWMPAFLLAAVVVLPEAKDRRRAMRLWAAAILVMLSAASKDVGVIGLAIVYFHQLTLGTSGGALGRIRRAWVATLPTLVTVGIYLINRSIVLEGFGGYPPKHQLTYPLRLQSFGASALRDLLCPHLFLPQTCLPAGWGQLHVALAAALMLSALCLLFVIVGSLSTWPQRRRVAVLVCLGIVWLLPSTVLLGAMLWYGPWYIVIPTVGLAMLVGAVSQGIISLLRGGWLEKTLAPAPAVCVVALLVLALYVSPLFVYYPEWTYATKALRQTLSQIDEKMKDAQPGDVVSVFCTPYVVSHGDARRPPLRFVATIMIRGIRCYLWIKYPEAKTRVIGQFVRLSPIRRIVRHTTAPIIVRVITPEY